MLLSLTLCLLSTSTFVAAGGCPGGDPCNTAVCKALPTARCFNEDCVAVFKHASGLVLECERYCTYQDNEGIEKIVPVGSTVTYNLKCHKGFTVTGKPNRLCIDHLTWSTPPVYCALTALDMESCDEQCAVNPCRGKTCPASTNAKCYCEGCEAVWLENERIVNCNSFCTISAQEGFSMDRDLQSIPVGATIEYHLTCAPGYRIVGATTISCVAHEKLQPPLPQCRAILNYCKRFPARLPRFGSQIRTGFIRVGSVIKFQCNIGYKLIGASSATCTATRKWSAKPPRCKKMCANLQNCLVNPCSSATCSGVNNAVCKPNYCGGCFAEWFVGNTKLTDKECQNPLCERLCPNTACSNYKCEGHSSPQCVPDTCNKCKPMFYDDTGKRIADDLCVRSCDTPCTLTKCVCEKFPNTVSCTVSDDCGKCVKTYKSGQAVLPGLFCRRDCGDDLEQDCREDPCVGASCPTYPNAVCVVNKCGGLCVAEFFVNNAKVDCGMEEPPSAPQCVESCTDPCIGAICNVPGAECRSNLCKCTLEWYEDDVQLSDKQCQEPQCKLLCPENACDNWYCREYENIQCIPDTCSRCLPMFYDLNGNRIDSKTCGRKSCSYKTSTGATKSVRVGAELQYRVSCPPGYDLAGQTTRKCIDHETWSGKLPYCRLPATTDCSECATNPCDGATCGAMPSLQCKCLNCKPTFRSMGRVVDCDKFCTYESSIGGKVLTMPVGGAIRYGLNCPPGTKIIGSLQRKCIAPSTWSGDKPTCG